MSDLDKQLQAWESLKNTYILLASEIQNKLSAQDLPEITYLYMLEKIGNSDRVRPKDVLGSVSVTKSGLTRLIYRMEKDEFVQRGNCPDDKRGVFLSSTPKGKRTLHKMQKARDEVFRERWSTQISDREADTITEALNRVGIEVCENLETDGLCDS